MSPEEEVRRGREAAIVTTNPIYQESLLIIKGQMLKAFQDTNYADSDGRDEIWRQMKIVDWLERQLASVMNTGKMASETLNLQQD